MYKNVIVQAIYLDRHCRRKSNSHYHIVILKCHLLQMVGDYRNNFHCIQCWEVSNEASIVDVLQNMMFRILFCKSKT